MTSCEPRHCSAYSDDLHWRMVWQQEGFGCTYDDVAKNLCVHKSMVKRIVDCFKLSGNVSKKPYPTHRAARKLILPAQLY
jgi:transposase